MADVWYLLDGSAPVVWSTAVVAGKVTRRIHRVPVVNGVPMGAVWATTGTVVSAARVTAARAEQSTAPFPLATATPAPGGTVTTPAAATTTTRGVVKLAGDLAGTADAPTVPGLAGKAPATRAVTAGAGLTGGGTLAADRTIAVNFGTAAGTVTAGDDPRLLTTAEKTRLAGITQFTAEQAQDAAAAMLTAGTHTGVTVTYDDTGNRVNVTTATQFAKVVHGAAAGTARPNAAYVLWEGSVQPTNWVDNDDWNEVA